MTEVREREQPTRLFRIPVADWDKLSRDRRLMLEEFSITNEPIAGIVGLAIDDADFAELDKKDRDFLASYDRTPGVRYVSELLKRNDMLWFHVPTAAMVESLAEQSQSELYMWCAFEDSRALTYAIPQSDFDKLEGFVQQWLQHYSVNAPQVTGTNTINVSMPQTHAHAAATQDVMDISERTALLESVAALVETVHDMSARIAVIEQLLRGHKHSPTGVVTGAGL